MTYGTLGTLAFQTPETLGFETVQEYGFTTIPKISGLPDVQVTAQKPLTATLTLRFSSEYNTNPETSFQALRTLAATRGQNTLTIGAANLGSFVVTRISKTVTRTTQDGHPYEIEATVNLLQTAV